MGLSHAPAPTVENGLPPGALGLLEIKAGQTFSADWLASLRRVAAILGEKVQRQMLVFGGAEHYVRGDVEVVGLQANSRNTV